MFRSTITGIDIGTDRIKAVIVDAKEKPLKVLGVGTAESRGLRHGYVVNGKDVTESIRRAIHEAESHAQVKVKKVFISIGGIGLGGITNTSSVIISRADSEITSLDIRNVQNQCEKDIPTALSLNKKIIHSIPTQFKIDGKIVYYKENLYRSG